MVLPVINSSNKQLQNHKNYMSNPPLSNNSCNKQPLYQTTPLSKSSVKKAVTHLGLFIVSEESCHLAVRTVSSTRSSAAQVSTGGIARDAEVVLSSAVRVEQLLLRVDSAVTAHSREPTEPALCVRRCLLLQRSPRCARAVVSPVALLAVVHTQSFVVMVTTCAY